MKAMFASLKNGGLFQAAEAAFAGALIDGLLESLTAGKLSADWKHLVAMSLAAALIAVRNYVKQPPRAPWTDEQRANNQETK